MSVLQSRPVLRWLAPAGAALAVIGGGLAIGALAAAADPALPQRTAAELLVDLQTARLDSLSGTVVQRADLGLPALPNIGGQGSSDLTSLVSGTHTLRVWYAGPDKARVALLGTLGETDVITNGTDLWVWSSAENTATHRTVKTDAAEKSTVPKPEMSAAGMTPQQIATLALAAIDPTTAVSTDGSAKIAGRDAYELVLTPRDPATRIGSVRLAIDATEHVPLRVQIYARGSDTAAIEVAFTQVSFARPEDQQFTFNPPPGAKVVQETDTPDQAKPDATKPEAKPQTALIGKGWTSVLVARLPQQSTADAGKGGDRDGPQSLMRSLPAVSGAWGSGRVLSSNLFSVLLTDDGRILVGAVSPERLYAAAADPAARLGS